MLFWEDTSDEMERGLLERLEMDRGFFVSLGSPPTGLPRSGEEHDKRTTAVQQRNHYLVTTQSVGRGRRLMQGRKGAPWRSWVPRRGTKIVPKMPPWFSWAFGLTLSVAGECHCHQNWDQIVID